MTSNDELLTRAVSDVVPRAVADSKLKTGEKMRIYFGIDPTGTKLHLGHSVPLRKMRAFQDAGHHVILLIGSFTAMIGDPTGRDEMRQELTAEDVKKNFETYIEQAKLILDMKKLEVRYNHEWLGKLSFKEILGLTSHFTVQQMLKRDMFAKRLKEDNPISVTEFMYPLMVGYDSVVLDVDCEIGGNDQLFNMLAGRTMQHAHKKRDKFVLTTKLIDGTDGRKMSKTYSNCVYLTDSAEEMYGRLLSMPDALIPVYMECCTDLPMTEVKAAEKALKDGKENPKNLKMRLAREIVTIYHSAEAAKTAEAAFENVFKNKGVPEDMPEYKAKKGESLIDALLGSGTVLSKSEARRLIEQGGVKVGDVVVKSVDAKAETGVVRVGKRKFVKIFL
ncbi:tyrosine--tRNA ligase [Candidatus Peribacteria bacterium]|nr:tyrosine--tRNA ligase [Candidatus Peribacteria bacterium]